MKIRLITFFILCSLLVTSTVKADSPLTSTYFAANYPEYPIIEKSVLDRSFNDEVAAFLLDTKHPIDAKAALINAIGWNYDATHNAEIFRGHLAKKHGTTTAGLQLTSLSSDELLCLGYIMAMDDYFNVDDAINVLEMAKNKKSESFTINIILALVKSQKIMDADYCQVWTLTADVLNDKSLKRDMKRVSIQNIVDYNILYKSDCYYGSY